LKLSPDTVKRQLKRTPIAKMFKMDPKNFPVFCVGIAQAAVSEVTDEVLVAQELLFECRIAIINWLRNQGEMLHSLSFGDNFDSMCEMAVPSEGDAERKKLSRTIVCDAFCKTSESAEVQEKPEDQRNAMWWETKYSHRVGPFLTFEGFPWIIIGYYLIRSEQRSKRLLFDHFLMQGEEEKAKDWSVEATEVLMAELEALPKVFLDPPNGWVPRCEAKMGGSDRSEVYSEIFNCMIEACQKFEEIVNDKGLAHSGEPLDQLFEVAFVMLQRLIVTKPFDGEMQWTGFANHLKQAVKSIKSLKDITKQLKDVREENAVGVQGICNEAIDLMRQAGSAKMTKWKKKMEGLEEEVGQIAVLSQQLTTGFVDGKDCITVITPRIDEVEEEAPESAKPLPTAGSFSMTEERTIDGWQILLGRDYSDCTPQQSKILTKWKLETGVDFGYFKTDRQMNWLELSQEEAEKEQGNGNRFVFKVDMKNLLQVNMTSGKERQLKPVGQTSISVRARSGALASGAMGNEVSPIPVSAVNDGLPEDCKRVNAEIKNKFTCSDPNPRCPDDLTYAKASIKAIRTGGSRVVVYYRRVDEYSSDPVGIDKFVLAELEMEPHVGCCYVIWNAPAHITNWTALPAWKKFAGDVKIRLVLTKDVASILEELEKELPDSSDEVDGRIASKVKKLKEQASTFRQGIQDFLDDRAGNEFKDAKYFQQHFREKIREIADSEIEKVRSTITPDAFRCELKVPDAEHLIKLPEFIGASVDRVGGESAASMNELKCRSFLSNILLGQTLSHAQKVARGMYDGAFMKVLDKVGEWFCMDGEVFLKELSIYCSGEDTDPDTKLIGDFIDREHFVQMFAGCTLWNIMPMLYSVVLPRLWDREKGGKGGICDSQYKGNNLRAIAMLKGDLEITGDKDGKGMAAP
jgi:hypothetical protein